MSLSLPHGELHVDVLYTQKWHLFFVRFILFSKMINEKEYEKFKKDTEEHRHGRPHSFSVNVLSVTIQHCFQESYF